MDNNSACIFTLMAKPVGPACNLSCEYCFYLEKQALFKATQRYRMPDHVLEQYVKKYLTSQDAQEVSFIWQGGEPLLAGISFYRKAVRLQKKYAGGKTVTNAIQTNGTLLNEDWCDFFAKNKFLVGLSLDGPGHIHDHYRKDSKGKATFETVLEGLKTLQQHQVEFNVLACVTQNSSHYPLEIYHFFKKQKVQFIQFIPVVERTTNEEAKNIGLKLATPPALNGQLEDTQVTPWSVEPENYGEFLIQIFDEWVRKDVGSTFVMNFETALGAWMGLDSSTCVFTRNCGQNMIMEHNGDIFSCDHYVYPDYCLGNILPDMPHQLAKSKQQVDFGSCKENSLPGDCRNCKILFACRGECPKHRFLKTSTGEPGLNYLCSGYKKYFEHIDEYMKAMAFFISKGYPVETIMEAARVPVVIYQKDS